MENKKKEEKKTKLNKGQKIAILIATIGIIIPLSLIMFFGILFNGKDSHNEDKLMDLPLPEIAGGSRGEMGIDKNINEDTIDNYLGRDDVVYRDMRMLEDPANYEAIGGDRFLSGYINGFEVVPLPYIIPVTGLPSDVGETYHGETLFDYVDGTYVANYQESYDILEELFPQDKAIFLMCGGGGYANMMKTFLITMGWDEDMIYNVGGYWYYKGKNDIKVPKTEDGKYDFSKVPYHEINFDNLIKIVRQEEKKTEVEEVKLSTSSITIEKDTSFKLTAIVLPNEAINKGVTWTSSDETTATVEWGIVVAKQEGVATITVTTLEGNKMATCEVTVTPSKPVERIDLDDISNEVEEYNKYDPDDLYNTFNSKVRYENGELKEEYRKQEYGGYGFNDLWQQEYNKYEEEAAAGIAKRKNILDTLVDNEKSFIIITDAATCQTKDFSSIEASKKILKNNNYSYLIIKSREGFFYESKLKFEGYYPGSIIIVNKGKVYGYLDPYVYSFNNEDELKTWLNKYFEVK